MKLTRVTCGLVGFVLLGLLLTSRASVATETVCFSWTRTVNGTISVDASGSIGATSFQWSWGDGSFQLPSSNPHKSHAYTSPPPYDRTITLFTSYPSGDTGNASCDTLPWIPPVGPPPPPGATCCGTVCPFGEQCATE
jgi:hypothetical protein